MRLLLGVFVAAVGVAALRGAGDLAGLPAVRTLQIWWTARQFEASALREDLDGLDRLGAELARLGAGDGALRFAAHRIGFQVTGESWLLPPAEARMRAAQGLSLLEGALARSGDPFEIRLIQALILVNRVDGPGAAEQREQVAEDWIAAGGGPSYPFTAPGEAYRAALALPAAEKSNFLTARFRIGFGESD
jgi:hypothetical protein